MQQLHKELILLIIKQSGEQSYMCLMLTSKHIYNIVIAHRSTLLGPEYDGNVAILPARFYYLLSMRQFIRLENDICTAQQMHFPSIKRKYRLEWSTIIHWVCSNWDNREWFMQYTNYKQIRNNYIYYGIMMNTMSQYRRYIATIVVGDRFKVGVLKCNNGARKLRYLVGDIYYHMKDTHNPYLLQIREERESILNDPLGRH